MFMTEPIKEPQPTSGIESDQNPETIGSRLKEMPFAMLREVLAEAERLAANTWQEKPDGFENIRGGQINVYESERSHKFMLEVASQSRFENMMSYLVPILGIEFDSVADAKAAVRKVLDERRARVIE